MLGAVNEPVSQLPIRNSPAPQSTAPRAATRRAGMRPTSHPASGDARMLPPKDAPNTAPATGSDNPVKRTR